MNIQNLLLTQLMQVLQGREALQCQIQAHRCHTQQSSSAFQTTAMSGRTHVLWRRRSHRCIGDQIRWSSLRFWEPSSRYNLYFEASSWYDLDLAVVDGRELEQGSLCAIGNCGALQVQAVHRVGPLRHSHNFFDSMPCEDVFLWPLHACIVSFALTLISMSSSRLQRQGWALLYWCSCMTDGKWSRQQHGNHSAGHARVI